MKKRENKNENTERWIQELEETVRILIHKYLKHGAESKEKMWAEEIFVEIIVENFTKLMKNIKLQT